MRGMSNSRGQSGLQVILGYFDDAFVAGASGFGRGLVLHGPTPELFRAHVQEAIQPVEPREPEDRIIFVKSWNEWAESNYLEPDNIGTLMSFARPSLRHSQYGMAHQVNPQ